MENVIIKHEKDKNEVRFTGEIIAKRSTRVLTSMTMRVTTKGGTRDYTNYPSFAVYDAELREKTDSLPLRIPVTVVGYVNSQKLTEEQRQRAAALGTPEQALVLTSIEVADEGAQDENSVEIVGAVERAYVGRGKILHFIIATIREEKYLKRIKVDVFPKEGIDYLDLMASGTRVKAIGHCATSTRNDDSGSRTTEYIVADEITRA